MNNKKSYVYKITCKITGEYYFGSSFNAKSDSYWGKGRKIKERISLYGKDNFVKEIFGEFDDRTIAHKVENQYIEQFINDEKCLNIHLDHHFGTYSDETCAKLSAANCGEKSPWYGKHHTEETRAKIGASLCGEKNHNFGKHFSEEHRAKIGAAMCGKKSPMRGKHWRKNPVTGKREWYE